MAIHKQRHWQCAQLYAAVPAAHHRRAVGRRDARPLERPAHHVVEHLLVARQRSEARAAVGCHHEPVPLGHKAPRFCRRPDEEQPRVERAARRVACTALCVAAGRHVVRRDRNIGLEHRCAVECRGRALLGSSATGAHEVRHRVPKPDYVAVRVHYSVAGLNDFCHLALPHTGQAHS
eukprot:6263326-Prymnesium_polylepis.2